MKPGGDALVCGGIRQQVTGDLFDRELIEWHILIECLDDPVAVGPDRSRVVFFVTIGVRISGEIEPFARPPLAVLW